MRQDANVKARPERVALVRRREDPDTLFFTRRLVLEGDTELGLANAIDAL